MSFPIRSKYLSPLELQYAELKKQSSVDQNNSQTPNGAKERRTANIPDEVTLSSVLTDTDEATKRKPSQPVTPDEMQALRGLFSIYA
ncbi:hypothetical protein SAMN02745119_01047 [Trichlorobacter thiogenes]|uniref:Uncharacterized protein n=1 Tax=Trichlorobacter thiogenes TaxID=115783 RepID=A0A1T4LWL9_9BACT|nr:hypothetical protein [Trichlorobacter thiogenes]SJZ59150.1 hypothetical protein SAMN02745119_01047 [Trichlorobacter thiogenes]